MVQKIISNFDRLTFLVDFISQDLRTISEGDVLNLREEMCDYLTPREGKVQIWAVAVSDGKPLSTYERKDFLELQREARKQLWWALDEDEDMRAWDVYLKDRRRKKQFKAIDEKRRGTQREDFPFSFRGRLAGLMKPGPGAHQLQAHGTVIQMFVLQTIFLLLNQNTNEIRRCPREGCGKLFVRKGKEIYCHPRCQQAVAKEKWLKKRRK